MAALTGEALRKAQKTVADRSIDLGQVFVNVDKVFSRSVIETAPQKRAFAVMQDIKEQFRRSLFPMALEFTTKGTISGVPATKAQVDAMLRVFGSQIRLYAEGADVYASAALTKAFKTAIAEQTAKAFALANKLAEGIGSVIEGGADVIDKAGKALGWLPWVLGAIVVGPLLLKTFSGYKSGGARGAADAASGELERARGALARKAKLAGVHRRRRSR
jgi:hypothetical protein